MMNEAIGSAWLIKEYEVTLSQPLLVTSLIGTSTSVHEVNGVRTQTFVKRARPDDTLVGHLTFALKREPIHLEFLSRLFSVINPSLMVNWINNEPSGQYARKACFLYEWLTGLTLDHPGVSNLNYVEVLDPEEYLTATVAENNPRWRIRDNLPGTPAFCPMIRMTPKLKAQQAYDPREEMAALGVEFGADTLLRSAVWLTIKESRSTYAIEHEQKQVDRIQRFAQVMENRCGAEPFPLSIDVIESLQRDILGDRALSYGLRQSPIFVGAARNYENVTHYLAPHWDAVKPMLEGLASFDNRTKGRNSILRAAALSFGFVYIHPMRDGNGRVSRFLINDVLRRDGAIPAPYILPVSAIMLDKNIRPFNYDQVLESYSKPLMRSIGGQLHHGERLLAPDGAEYDLHFSGYDNTLPAWRYIDMTTHAEYIGQIIELTISQEMRQEAQLLRAHYRARAAIKDVLEGPDQDIDRIIRAVKENRGRLGNKLLKEYPILKNPDVAADVISAVSLHLPWGEDSLDGEAFR